MINHTCNTFYDVTGMLLNGNDISTAVEWRALPGSLDLVGAYIPLSSFFYYAQSLTLQHVNGDREFAAYVYGLGSECGFAYPIGYCLDDIRVRTRTSTRFAIWYNTWVLVLCACAV